MANEERAPAGIDVGRPSIARTYDYFLGGKDNFAADREMARMVLEIAPDAREAALANRAFLRRVVRYLAAERGIRQFIDIGSGLPTQGNVHEIAAAVDPDARTVYVDNDPIVLVHGRALLADTGASTVIAADVREPEKILDDPGTREFIDFDRPVGLLMLAILHHVNDADDPADIAARLRSALPAGSYLAISHFHNPGAENPPLAEMFAAAEKVFNATLGTGRWRTRDEIRAYLGDMELVEPGLVPIPEWRPDPADRSAEGFRHSEGFVGGVARKP